MKCCVIALTVQGQATAQRIAESLPDCKHVELVEGVLADMPRLWQDYRGIICVMATGIVVRAIAPLIRDKASDPCVVVVDQLGRYAVSLLSGHLGGGNALSTRVALATGGDPVITTASDSAGVTALDLWARRHGLLVTNKELLTSLTARLVNGYLPSLYSDLGCTSLPADFRQVNRQEAADIVITYKKHMTMEQLCCIPKVLFLGIGCNRGTPVSAFHTAFAELCEEHGLDQRAIAGAASIDLKSDEEGLVLYCQQQGWSLSFYTREQLNEVKGIASSPQVMAAIGAKGVAEPAALLAAGEHRCKARLLVPKMKWQDVTLAVAVREKTQWD